MDGELASKCQRQLKLEGRSKRGGHCCNAMGKLKRMLQQAEMHEAGAVASKGAPSLARSNGWSQKA